MINSIAIALSFIICLCSCSANNSDANNASKISVNLAGIKLIGDTVKLSIKVTNTANKQISFSTFEKGRFEPISIKDDKGVAISKQGGWDLVKVNPVVLNFNDTLASNKSINRDITCINSEDFKSLDNAKICISLFVEGKWVEYSIETSKENKRQKTNL